LFSLYLKVNGINIRLYDHFTIRIILSSDLCVPYSCSYPV